MENAATHLLMALNMEPDNKDNWVMLARTYFEAADYREALNLIEKAILQFEDNTDLYYIKSAFYYQIGNRNESFINLERALLQDFEGFTLMFEVTPHMEYDDHVLNIIDQYRK